jgi:D-3-phosphoglycerate dehydrogenase / 2-oxoglutarate reductase
MALPVLLVAGEFKNSPELRKHLESAFEVRCVPSTAEALAENLPEADAYYASLKVQITRELMERAPRLRAIATASTGRDHIDLKAAGELGIEVISLKEDRQLLDRITATAELAWALLLACERRLPEGFNAARQGRWGRDEFRGHQIAYKTLGILGCGRLGTIVSQYGRAFRMNVLGNDILPISVEGVRMVPLDELLSQSDVLSIHIHLNDENRGFVNRERIFRMKKGAVLINTSRGAIVDEAALLEALKSGHLAAAGVDVIEGEWRTDLEKHPLIEYARTHENLIITPHVGGVTWESQAMASAAAADKLIAFFKDLGKKR